MKPHIQISKEEIAEFCKENQIRKFSLFGSVLRKDFNPQSDIDVLVEFKPGKRVGLLRMGRMVNELSILFKRPVDLRTPADLSRYFREEVVNSAEIQYAEQ